MRSTNSSPVTIARSAMASATANACVLFRVLVAAWAVSFAGLVLAGDSTAGVFDACNGLQMGGIYAAANSAQVVKLKTFRYRPNEQFVAHAMSEVLNPCNFNLPVSSVVASANPKPAPSVWLGDTALKDSVEQRLDGKLIDSHVTPFSRIGQGRAALARCCGPLLSIITSTTPKAPTILGVKRLITKE